MDEKNMHFANFNITFGENDLPMLEHFEDIIFPAFTSGLIRGKKDVLPYFSFGDVRIKKINGEYVLVGNYIKSTEYKVITTVTDGVLVSSPADVPTAPYSRFIIFLKNHRMILVRNETNSPDIRSFQKTVRDILAKYIQQANADRPKESKLPIAIVHIVDIPLKDSIEQVLKDVNKVNWLKLKFFPLNNDLDPTPLARVMKNDMQKVGSKTGNLVFNSPSSKEGIKNVIEATGGTAVATLQVTDSDGEKRRIQEGAFSATTKVGYEGNLNASEDTYLIEQAKKNPAITITSPENLKIYNRMMNTIKKLIGQ